MHRLVMHSTLWTNSLSFSICIVGGELSAGVHGHQLKYKVHLSLCILLCYRYRGPLHPCKTETLYS